MTAILNISSVSNKLNAEKLKLDFLAWRLQDTGRTEVIEFHLLPGEVIGDHQNPSHAVFYVMQGNGLLTIEKETVPVKKGDAIQVEKNLVRNWKNTGSRRLKVLVIKEL